MLVPPTNIGLPFGVSRLPKTAFPDISLELPIAGSQHGDAAAEGAAELRLDAGWQGIAPCRGDEEADSCTP